MWRPPNELSRKGLLVVLKFAWKLIKIIFVALIIFGIISMIVSLVVTFTLSTKMALEMAGEINAEGSWRYCESLQSKNQEKNLVTLGILNCTPSRRQ